MNKLECNLENKQMCRMSDDPNLDYCRACTHLLTNVKIESLAPDYPIIIENIEEEVIIDIKPISNNANKIRLDDIHQDSTQYYRDIKIANSLKEKTVGNADIDLEDLPVGDTIEVEQALRYNDGKPKWSLVHFQSLIPMVRVLEYGCIKYAPKNWQKPMDTTQILESMQRHLAALFDGEEVDSESGISHMGHIMANAMFFNYHKQREKDGGIN